ncbi:MAG: T9SS type A sorting domain-containing protein [Chlorobi bacterium]|nr:T9SS type A sorting domain-containing protein [Chlorobiota bacterium]
MLRTILILTVLIVFSGKVFAGDTSDVVWKKDYPMHSSSYMVLSPDEQYICLPGGGGIQIVNAETGDLIRTTGIGGATGVVSLSFFPDSDKLAYRTFTAQSQNLVVYSISEDKIIENIAYEPHDDYDPCVYCDVSPDGSNVITCGRFAGKENIWIHSSESYEIIKKLDFYNEDQTTDYYLPYIVKYSPSGKYVAALAYSKDFQHNYLHTVLKVWNMETGEYFIKTESMDGGPIDISFSDDEKYLAVLSIGTMNIIDIDSKTIIDPIENQHSIRQVLLNNDKIAINSSRLLIYDFVTKKLCYEYSFKPGGLVMTKDKNYFYTVLPDEELQMFVLHKIYARWDVDAIAEEMNDYFVIEITPNPIVNISTITINSPGSKQVEISITDMNGNQLLVVFNGLLVAGENRFPIDYLTLSSGTYFCTVSSNDNKQSVKFIVNK